MRDRTACYSLLVGTKSEWLLGHSDGMKMLALQSEVPLFSLSNRVAICILPREN
jgi:hypothetical protein